METIEKNRNIVPQECFVSNDLSNLTQAFTGDLPTEETLMGMYLSEVGKNLLTRGQEIDLALAYEAGKRAQDRLDRGAENTEDLLRVIKIGEDSFNTLVKNNLGLVVSIAGRYKNRGVPILDLIQEGNIGLIRAAEKYDWRVGNRFSTYAYLWIKQGVRRAIHYQSRVIRVPVHIYEKVTAIHNVIEALQAQEGRTPSCAEIAEEVGEDDAKIVAQIINFFETVVSLESPVLNSTDKVQLKDVIGDSSVDVEDTVSKNMLKYHIWEALNILSTGERSVLMLQFGLNGSQELTDVEIGRIMDMSNKQVFAISKRAMTRLRNDLHIRQLREDFLSVQPSLQNISN